jgi:flavin-dependent dehydrogenase
MTSDLLIIGGGATGQLAAAYFRKHFPGLSITVVDRPGKNRPIVGESFVELTIGFLLDIDLGAYLVEQHYPKYGLTYYHKLDINNPADRTYFVDEAPSVPPQLSFQVNRFTFDHEVRRRNCQHGVHMVTGTVVGVQLAQAGEKLHCVIVEGAARQKTALHGRWLIDATGRNRVLAKYLHLQQTVKEQKNVFWFRLTNFDASILGRIHALKKENLAFVPYFATHHFFGKGNWIWCIPMRSPEAMSLISIGITCRTDQYPYGEIRTMEQFLDCVGQEHEVIAELVRSGTVVDTNFYRTYMWECRQRYSPDRWYILGDAGDTVDPLYSIGMALASTQIRQIAAIVKRDLAGWPIAEFTGDLDTVITTLQRSVTHDTTSLYECMHDPYQCHLRIHLVVSKLFRLATPLLMNGYAWDPLGAKLINRFASLQTLERDSRIFHELIREVAANPGNRRLENFVKVQSFDSMNYRFFEYHREQDIPDSLARLSFSLARLRLDLLAKLGWRGWTRWPQHRALLLDLARALLLKGLFSGVNLRDSRLVRRLLSGAELTSSPVSSVAAASPQPIKNPLT